MDKIPEEDTNWLKRLALTQFDDQHILCVERLGGMTNRTYKVALASGTYVFRLPGNGIGKLICRHDEKISTELACELEIDAPLYFFDEGTGVKITRFVECGKTMCPQSMRREENLSAAAMLLRKLHTCGRDTKVRFEIFEIAKSYEDFAKLKRVRLFENYEYIYKTILELKKKMDIKPSYRVPCHNDPLCENWVCDPQRMYLIDWEYAGMNDPMWDLADLSIEAEYDMQHDRKLLHAYFGRTPTQEETFRFDANKIYLDFLWSLWGKTQVPSEGKAMEEYAQARYCRLQKNLDKII